MELITFLFMKNENYILILFSILGLTSCLNGSDNSLTTDSTDSLEIASGDTSKSGKDRAISNLNIEDSSKYYFFVENPSGTIDYQRYNFHQSQWQTIHSPIQQPFMAGPLSTGRIIYQKDLWRDSSWCFLYGKQPTRGMVLEVKALALLEINDDPSRSVYIMVPQDPAYQMPECNTFDEWFTNCNDQRFFVQYWMEHQFTPRYVRRLQWKPFSLPSNLPL